MRGPLKNRKMLRTTSFSALVISYTSIVLVLFGTQKMALSTKIHDYGEEEGGANLWASKLHGAFVRKFSGSSTESSKEAVERQGKEGPSGAVLFSPHVILDVLALLREGAGGETRQELDKFLGSPEVFDAKQKALKTHTGDEFLSGSAIFFDERIKGDAKFEEYRRGVHDKYSTELQLANFSTKPSEALDMINGFVKQTTKGRIQKILEQGDITPDTDVVIASAIFFKAKWKLPFKATDTLPEDFTTVVTEDGKRVAATVPNVLFMHREFRFQDLRQGAAFHEADETVTAVLPYEAEGWFMVFVMHKDALQFEAFENSSLLDVRSHVREARAQTEKEAVRRIQLSLPKFRIEAETRDLISILSEIGMPSMFSHKADFSNICGGPSLRVTRFVTRAMIEVDEEGTTAAAAAAAVMFRSAFRPEMPLVVKLNRPFVAALLYTPPGAKDTQDDIVVFQLRITNPLALQKEFKETW